jgi:hypothetical protein
VYCAVDFFGWGRVLRPILLLGLLFLVLKKYWKISSHVVCISFVKHVVQRSILTSPSTSSPACITSSRAMILFSGAESSVSIFWLWRPTIFLPDFLVGGGGAHPSESMLWICLVLLPNLIVFSQPLLYLVGLNALLSLGIFLCCSCLWKCSTSNMLNLRKVSYNSSRILGRTQNK